MYKRILCAIFILLTSNEVSGFSCKSVSFTSSATTVLSSQNGIFSCYLLSSQKVTFEDATRLCEVFVNTKMIFVETSIEQSLIKDKSFSHKAFWLGVTPALGGWYWTYDLEDIGQSVDYSDWVHPPSPKKRLILDFSATTTNKWIPVDPNEVHYAVCEIDLYWETKKSDYIPMSSITTTPQPEEVHLTTLQAVLSRTTSASMAREETTEVSLSFSNFDYSRCRSVEMESTSLYMTRVGCAFYKAVYLSMFRGLLSCLRYCMTGAGCCGLAYSNIDGNCYELFPTTFYSDTATALNSSIKTMVCYYVR